MSELEQLVAERNGLANILNRMNEAIAEQQIVKETHMKMFGFNKVTEGTSIILYAKKLSSGAVYEIILDLVRPSIVTIHRGKQEKSYGFEITSIEEFRELLIFGNLL
jgi:Holliday junction resolvasome RuvABC DNA-binding subunit